MNLVDWLDFLAINTLAAVAIAIDACALVLVRFRAITSIREALKWAIAVGATHVAMPLVGFVLGWWVVRDHPDFAAHVYGAGAVMLAVLVWIVLREAMSPAETWQHAASSSTKHQGPLAGAIQFWLAVGSVSVDAMLSGPGKVVLLNRYPPELAWLSFAVVGLLVACLTLCAGLVALRINRLWLSSHGTSASRLSKRLTAAIASEVSLFTFFMIWSCAGAASHLSFGNGNFVYIVAWLALNTGLALAFGRAIVRAQAARAVVILESSALLSGPRSSELGGVRRS